MRFSPLILLLGVALLAPAVGAEPGSFKGVAGLQLYSLRDQFKTDVPGTLDKVKAYGITEVELASFYDKSPAEFRQMLESRGLKPISGHMQYDALKKDIAGAVRDAKTVGLQYVACPWIPHSVAEFSESDARQAAKDFNTWGEAFRKKGSPLHTTATVTSSVPPRRAPSSICWSKKPSPNLSPSRWTFSG